MAKGELAGLVEKAATIDPGDVSAVASLRKRHSAEDARTALQLAEGRRRLAGKVEDPERWLADSNGAQMATDRLIAQHKAQRFERSGGHVIDLCSGIGADAKELAATAGVRCVELDACRAVMCRYNTGCEVLETDAAGFDVQGARVHFDPARRGGSGRVLSLDNVVPGPAAIGRIVRESDGACIKLMPGLDRADIDDMFPDIGGELEHISLRGRMSQAVWWTGELTPGDRLARATMIMDEGVETISGVAARADALSPLGRWLYAVDPAPERAGLLGQLAGAIGVGVLHPSLGVLTSDERIESPWLTAFAVLDRMPWRVERVREALATLGGGIVEVKTRGGAVDPDKAQRELRGEGDRTLTVFVLRFGSKVEAIVTERA